MKRVGGYLSLFVKMVTVGVLCANVLLNGLLLCMVSKHRRHLLEGKAFCFWEECYANVSPSKEKNCSNHRTIHETAVDCVEHDEDDVELPTNGVHCKRRYLREQHIESPV